MAPKRARTQDNNLIPYATYHAAAIPHKPQGTILKATTWIAILSHTITHPSAITETSDFLWLKCHPRITIKTLKNEYFMRHPLEDFELKFDHIFPADGVCVRNLSRWNPVQDAKGVKVVVLRAIDAEDIEDEMAKEEAWKSMKNKYGGGGTSSDDAVVLDEDGEVDLAHAVEKHVARLDDGDEDGDVDDEMPTVDLATKREHKRPRYEADAQLLREQATAAMSVEADTQSEAEVEGKVADQTSLPPVYLETWDWTAFLQRLHLLSPKLQAKINDSAWAHCYTCGKQMCMKPWTQFSAGEDLDEGALCTSCTKGVLEGPVLKELDKMVEEEVKEKEARMELGLVQDLDADAPLDWKWELGNVHADETEAEVDDGEERNEMDDAAAETNGTADGAVGVDGYPDVVADGDVDGADIAADGHALEHERVEDNEMIQVTNANAEDEVNEAPPAHRIDVQSLLNHESSSSSFSASDTVDRLEPKGVSASFLAGSPTLNDSLHPSPATQAHYGFGRIYNGSTSNGTVTVEVEKPLTPPTSKHDEDAASEASFVTADNGEGVVGGAEQETDVNDAGNGDNDSEQDVTGGDSEYHGEDEDEDE